MVWDCARDYRISASGETNRTNRRAPVSILAFLFIVVSLLSFVAAQLILKRAMELSATLGFRSEERRVGKECRSRWATDHEKKNRKQKRRKGARNTIEW